MRDQTSRFTTDEQRWQAIVARDLSAQGAFLVGVRTTGVFCRPGCASRMPRRENVVFFESVADALRQGFRPCKRCKPDQIQSPSARVETVVRACQLIENADEQPSLEAIAEHVKLSPWHFHRVFTDAVGITPKRYAAMVRLRRFNRGLNGAGTVTAAIYEAGYSSSSRAYEEAAPRLGMLPSVKKRGGAGEVIAFTTAPCSLGLVLVAATPRGVCAVEIGTSATQLRRHLQEMFPEAVLTEDRRGLAETVKRVTHSIDDPAHVSYLPLDIRGTAFEERVWRKLQTLVPGDTTTYGDLARLLRKPSAARAVANACASNKLAVVVPCHRVVRGDGGLGGYRWGMKRKRALLEKEQSGGTGI